jgi:DNA recombination protein RmuC
MMVYLPGGRNVVVDAKAVLDAYLDAVAATDEQERNEHLRRHAGQIRKRVQELSAKSYWDKLPATPEFVVLFLPSESFFSEAVRVQQNLIEDAVANRVVIASPTTLIALLRAIAFGWRQEQIAANAERISQQGRELFERMRTLAEHIGRIGKELDGATRAYNQAVGSLESRVLPAARRFQELGAAGGDQIPEVGPVERTLRQLDQNRFEDQ